LSDMLPCHCTRPRDGVVITSMRGGRQICIGIFSRISIAGENKTVKYNFSILWNNLTNDIKQTARQLSNTGLYVVPKKTPPDHFLNNSVKNKLILIIFFVLAYVFGL